MSLTIGLADAKTTDPYPTMSVSFEDDGYYWFCHPFFERVKRETGQYIDLYGGAWFEGASLDALATALDDVAASATTMPTVWDVCIGYIEGAVGGADAPTAPEPFYSTVQREELVKLVDAFRALVRDARARSKWVACLGD